MKSPEMEENQFDYEALRLELERFLSSVGERVLAFRIEAEKDPSFARRKEDTSIVTKADELAETLIRAWITERFPDDAIQGEEQDDKAGGERTWIIDPIDGTSNFAKYGHTFGVSVGLFERNIPKLGVIFYPAEHIMLSSADSLGVRINGERVTPPTGHELLSEAVIASTIFARRRSDPNFIEPIRKLDTFFKDIPHRELVRSFTVDFLNLIREDIDAIVLAGATPYDIGAMGSMVGELGFSMTDLDGRPIDYSKEVIPVLITKNPKLHQSIIERLNS